MKTNRVKVIPLTPMLDGMIDGGKVYEAVKALADFDIPEYLYEEIDMAFAEMYKQMYTNVGFSPDDVFYIAVRNLRRKQNFFYESDVWRIIDYIGYYLEMTHILKRNDF